MPPVEKNVTSVCDTDIKNNSTGIPAGTVNIAFIFYCLASPFQQGLHPVYKRSCHKPV